ncbi:MAG: GMC oxidoreductase, partial [Pseudomonadota bacterium]
TPPEMGARDAYIFNRLSQVGLSPYRLHCGCRFVDGCGPCLGRVCHADCKRHAANSFLLANTAANIALLSDTTVLRLNANSQAVVSATANTDGVTHEVKADAFILAASSYFSPALLLKSSSEDWPDGLANRHDQVGRNLMFHAGRSLAIWAKSGLTNHPPSKSIVIRDFYDAPGGPYGEIQSTGAEAAYGNLVYALRQQLETSRWSRTPLLSEFTRVPAMIASKLLGNAAIFEMIVEDFPYPENRVTIDGGASSGVHFEYTIPAELKSRFDQFSRLVDQRLKGVRRYWLSSGVRLNYGHPAGTCRMGIDPANSVVDANGAAHGLCNLYVADGSALPVSGGTNPSLTIAANALRIGALVR